MIRVVNRGTFKGMKHQSDLGFKQAAVRGVRCTATFPLLSFTLNLWNKTQTLKVISSKSRQFNKCLHVICFTLIGMWSSLSMTHKVDLLHKINVLYAPFQTLNIKMTSVCFCLIYTVTHGINSPSRCSVVTRPNDTMKAIFCREMNT